MWNISNKIHIWLRKTWLLNKVYFLCFFPSSTCLLKTSHSGLQQMNSILKQEKRQSKPTTTFYFSVVWQIKQAFELNSSNLKFWLRWSEFWVMNRVLIVLKNCQSHISPAIYYCVMGNMQWVESSVFKPGSFLLTHEKKKKEIKKTTCSNENTVVLFFFMLINHVCRIRKIKRARSGKEWTGTGLNTGLILRLSKKSLSLTLIPKAISNPMLSASTEGLGPGVFVHFSFNNLIDTLWGRTPYLSS